ncbi:MAG: radical SAM protein [Candidatus Diapherotrites archaeon]|nr:radical SAM protein [Candidatus Diapherotrites archaeon]
MKKLVYVMPHKSGILYLNFGAECLNNCRFCIKRFENFYGNALETNYSPKLIIEIKEELKKIKIANKKTKEIVFCGIGEPFLHYETLIEIAKFCRKLFGEGIQIRADTAGLWWGANKNLSFLDYITGLSVSLNAESEEKYEQMCQPKIQNAYGILMDFLTTLSKEKKKRKKFPKIRLTIVDTSDKKSMPERKKGDRAGDCPVPNFEKCEKIAENLGFPLEVRKLFKK